MSVIAFFSPSEVCSLNWLIRMKPMSSPSTRERTERTRMTSRGIETVEHAVDRLLDQLGVIRLLDVVGAHALEHVAEQIELPVGVGGGRLRARAEERHAAGLRGGERDGHTGCCTEEDQRSLAYHP